LYTPSVLREALRFFNEIGFLLIKKKKNLYFNVLYG
jgi:hypothetical protein